MSLVTWTNTVNKEGVESLRPKGKPGRRGQLTDSVRRKLEQDLEKSPKEFGVGRHHWWDGPSLVEHLRNRFEIELNERQAQRWLRELGYDRSRHRPWDYIDGGYDAVEGKALEDKVEKLTEEPEKAPKLLPEKT